MYKIENGVHDLSNLAYHSSEGISRSALMEFKKSPHHYWHKYLNPKREPTEPTKAMKLGEYVHALVLEGEYFDSRYALRPIAEKLPECGLLKDLGREEYDRQKAEQERARAFNKELMERFEIESIGKEIIDAALFAEAKLIADAVLANEDAKLLFDGAQVEKSIYFTHELTGLQCKVRPDAWIGGVVTDLKTCADASIEAFKREAYHRGYFIQAGMIKQALESIGMHLEKFFFFCVEKTESLPCVYYPLADEDLYRGSREFDNLMIKMSECKKLNRWPSYQSEPLTYPGYIRFNEEL